jgi:hypothetical protein
MGNKDWRFTFLFGEPMGKRASDSQPYCHILNLGLGRIEEFPLGWGREEGNPFSRCLLVVVVMEIQKFKDN